MPSMIGKCLALGWLVLSCGSAATAAEKPNPTAQAQAQLQAGPWTVEVTPLGVAAAKPQSDTLTFTERKMTSKRLAAEGYPSSNITLNIGDDGVPVWETMQTKEGDGVAFWRGELRGNTMRGIISKHPLEGPAVDFSFKGTGPAAPATTAPAVEAEAPASGSPAPSTTVETPTSQAPAAPQAPAAAPVKRKRKGWF